MTAQVASATAGVVRDGDALRFSGALLRASVAALWARLPAQDAGVRRIALGDVERIDSAGLALIALLAARHGADIEGTPPGFEELRTAYRLGHGLAFARD